MKTLRTPPPQPHVTESLEHHPAPRGIELELVKIRDRIEARINGSLGEIEVLSQVHDLVPWLFHVLLTFPGERETDGSTIAAIYDDHISVAFKGKEKYDLELIRTLFI